MSRLVPPRACPGPVAMSAVAQIHCQLMNSLGAAAVARRALALAGTAQKDLALRAATQHAHCGAAEPRSSTRTRVTWRRPRQRACIGGDARPPATRPEARRGDGAMGSGHRHAARPGGRRRGQLAAAERAGSRVQVPLGVVGIIYESRPNVTADAGAFVPPSPATR